METSEALIRLDHKTYGDPIISAMVNEILSRWPRNVPNSKEKGYEVAHYAEDMHLSLAIWNGGRLLRNKQKALF